MNHPICVYRDKEIANVAANCARNNGAVAQIKTETLITENGRQPLFVIRASKGDTQKVVDTIADSADQFPRLTENAEHCPQCESILVEYPECQSVSPTMRGITALMDSISHVFGLSDNEKFYCKHCHNTWNYLN